MMSIRFHRLQPIPPAHPRAPFPTLPVLGRMGGFSQPFAPRSRFLSPDTVFTISGKSATYWALRDAGVAAGDEVCVPAYHCPTMVHPVLAIGAQPVMVPVGADLAVRLAVLAGMVTERTRAVLLPHFFGYVQPEIEAILAFCRARRIVLVEDCAHAFYGGPDGPLPGSWGDYAIASTRKFFPASEGGAVVANGRSFGQRLRRPGLVSEVRGLYDILHESARYGALPLTGGQPARDDARIGPADERASAEEAAPAPASEQDLRSAKSDREALRSAVWLIRHADHARIAAVRRRRFDQWRETIAGLRSVEAFVPAGPASQVPYVFPVRLLRPQAQFRALKYAGVAVWRWDQLAESDCAVSARLAVELVQMPCQHSMPDEAFDRLLDLFRRVVGSA